MKAGRCRWGRWESGAPQDRPVRPTSWTGWTSVPVPWVTRRAGFAFSGGSLGGRLTWAGLPADNLVSLAQTLGGWKRDGWSPTGTVDVAARLEPAAGGSRIFAAATLGAVGFSSPAGDVMGQKLVGRVALETLLQPKPRVIADLILRQGEALWGTMYVDLGKDPLSLHATGTRMGPDEYEDLVPGGRPRGVRPPERRGEGAACGKSVAPPGASHLRRRAPRADLPDVPQGPAGLVDQGSGGAGDGRDRRGRPFLLRHRASGRPGRDAPAALGRCPPGGGAADPVRARHRPPDRLLPGSRESGPPQPRRRGEVGPARAEEASTGGTGIGPPGDAGGAGAQPSLPRGSARSCRCSGPSCRCVGSGWTNRFPRPSASTRRRGWTVSTSPGSPATTPCWRDRWEASSIPYPSAWSG